MKKEFEKNSTENQASKPDKNLKAWKAPKLQVEKTNNTLGGTISANAPGDDAWYVS